MKSFRRFIIEAKLEYQGEPLDADKLFGAGGRFDPADPSAPKERSFVTPEGLNLTMRSGLNTKMSPLNRSAFSNTDLRTNIPIGGFYSISHEAKLINSKTGHQKPKSDSLLVSSNRTEEGDLEFKIRKTTFEDVQDIHRYILPAGETNLNAESDDGHKVKPGASHRLSISDASRVIQEHMLSRIKTGKKDMVGQTVAEAHGVEL